MLNQCQRILQYMEDFGSITSAQAMTDIGVYRLASRICDLKGMGYAIKSVTKTAKNRYGEPTRFKEYSLDKDFIPPEGARQNERLDKAVQKAD